MNTRHLKTSVLLLLFFAELLCSPSEIYGQATATRNGTLFTQNALYYSAQTKQRSSFTGQLTITKTDSFECGSATLSQNGPILVTVDKPMSYTCGAPMSNTWNGNITVDPSKAPDPGKVADASITANATYYYSKPCGSTPCGTSNPCCANTPISGYPDKIAISTGYPNSWNVGTADSPKYHGWATGNKTETATIKVYSIKVEIEKPEIITTTDSATFTAIPFPATGGKFLWSTGDTTQSIKLLVDKAMTLTVTYTILAVSFMAAADVCKLTSETVAKSPADRKRTKIGVGEEVNITYEPGKATWEATGSGELKGKGATITYVAGEKKEEVVVTADGKGGKCSIKFEVVPPERVTMDRKKGTVLKHKKGRPDCGWLGLEDIPPADVNFYRVEIREKDSQAETEGSYDKFKGVWHGKYDEPDRVSDWTPLVVHTAKGSSSGIDDKIYSGDPGKEWTGEKPPFKAGTMVFSMTWQWRVIGKKNIFDFPVFNQEHEIFGDKEEKKDKKKEEKEKKKDEEKEKEYKKKKDAGICESRKAGHTEKTNYDDETGKPW